MLSRTSLILKLVGKGLEPSQIVTRLELREVLQDCRSVLDVGCGPDSSLHWIEVEQLTGIEGYAPSCELAKKNKTHHELVLGDIRELDRLFKPGQFDACVALDVIEHLSKEDGLKLMRAMEKISGRKTVFLTPNGFLPQGHTESADLQEHLSGWEAGEMEKHGYRVTGILGPKSLRGEYHALKRRPKIFWGVVSLLGHFFSTRRQPAKAAAILCVKTVANAR